MASKDAGACHVRLAILPGDAAADWEVKMVTLLGAFLVGLLGCAGYALHVGLRRRPQLRVAVLGAVLTVLPVVPCVLLHAHGPLQSKMAQFAVAFFGVVSTFRWLELLCGTGPQGFDRSLRNFVVYFASPAEVLFAADGRFQATPPGRLGELVVRTALHMVAGTVVVSLGRVTSFVPLLEPGTDVAALPWMGFPRALPAVYLQALYVYCLLATAMLLHRFPLALVGIDTVDPMKAPLVLSTSLRDFWGRRWNLLIHRLMKRTFFMPFAAGPARSRHFGGFLAFVMSGVFHEYMWLVVNWPALCDYVPGLALLFFIAQFFLCAAEAALARTTLGSWASKLPWPLSTAAVTLTVLPLGPLFLQGIQGMAVQGTKQMLVLIVVPARSPLPVGASVSPPTDLVALGAFALLGFGQRVLLRRRSARVK